MNNINILMPFSRQHLKEILTSNYENLGIKWIPIIEKEISFKNVDWIQPVKIEDKEPFDWCYHKLNYFINTQKINDEDYYWFMCDDSYFEKETVQQLKNMNYDIIIISMHRGHCVPHDAEYKHPTNTLVAHPNNVHVDGISLEQIIVKGKILKNIQFSENSHCADGLMAEELKKRYDNLFHYEPNLIVYFNYYQNGRWLTEKDVTGVVVSHNTKKLLERAITSIRKFHPEMKIIIIDGSDKNDTCYEYICKLTDKNTRVFHAEFNIGHGRGLCDGLSYVETQCALLFDSDIEMKKSPIKEMLRLISDGVYGVGYIQKVDVTGHLFGSKKDKIKYGAIKYLHPYFSLIQIHEYMKYEPFIHHGSPAINTMLDIHKRGVANSSLKEFDKIDEYIKHDFYGTRGMRVSKKLEEIEGIWDKEITIESNGITVITCTGDRPKAFDLCLRWIKNQTIKPNQWIIVDDGALPMLPPNLDYVKYIRRKPQVTDPKTTMVVNFKEALKHISGEKIVIMEDDEYYAPTYIQEMSKLLDSYTVVGIGRSKYYNVITKTYHLHDNMGHASFAETCFKSEFVSAIKNVLEGDDFLDVRIWDILFPGESRFKTRPEIKQRVSKDKHGIIIEDLKNLYVGIKGLPGRGGIGSGHKGIGNQDVGFSVLRSWIPKMEDFNIYVNIGNNTFNNPVSLPINRTGTPLRRIISKRQFPQVSPPLVRRRVSR